MHSDIIYCMSTCIPCVCVCAFIHLHAVYMEFLWSHWAAQHALMTPAEFKSGALTGHPPCVSRMKTLFF